VMEYGGGLQLNAANKYFENSTPAPQFRNNQWSAQNVPITSKAKTVFRELIGRSPHRHMLTTLSLPQMQQTCVHKVVANLVKLSVQVLAENTVGTIKSSLDNWPPSERYPFPRRFIFIHVPAISLG